MKIKQLLYYIGKRVSEYSHRTFFRRHYDDFYTRYKNCKNKKNHVRIKYEMWQLWRYWKVYPIHYFRYSFYKSTCTLTIEDMKKYIPDYFAYYLLFPKSCKNRGILCEDKRLMSRVAKGLEINHPYEMFSIHNGHFLSSTSETISEIDILPLIKKSQSQKIFIKPTLGVGGKGIYVFNKKGDVFYNKDYNVNLDSSFLQQLLPFSYIVQEEVIQHPELNQIYPHSLNTFRIITEIKDNFTVDILFSLLRMGHGGNQVDNASSGGIYVKINSKTGVFCSKAYADQDHTFEEHPDTKFEFKDYRFPMWDEVITFTKEIALKFCEIKYIGWDIAFSSNGPVMIEANNAPSIEIIQDVYGGVQFDFGIRNPSHYWFSDSYYICDN